MAKRLQDTARRRAGVPAQRTVRGRPAPSRLRRVGDSLAGALPVALVVVSTVGLLILGVISAR